MLLVLFSLVVAGIVHPTALNSPLPNYGPPIHESKNIIDAHFATSWDLPYPSAELIVPKEFDHVQLTINFETDGRQYDRLGHILIDGIEIWRFSTPEPNFRTIESTLEKDVSDYTALFKNGAHIELNMANSLLGPGLGGILNVTISIAYFNAPNNPERSFEQWWYDEVPTKYVALQPKKEISNVPPKETLHIPQLSKQTTRVGIQLAASGNSGEEFWYTNLNNNTGSTRQARITIDGVVAGFIDPFQAAYTGAWYPGWWNSLAGAQDYDIPSYFIDISSFLPQLWVGDATLEVAIVNGFNDDVIGAQWLVNTALVVWEDPEEEAIGGYQQVNNPTSDALVRSWNDGGINVDYTGLYNSVDLNATLFFQNKTIHVNWSQKGNSYSAQNYNSSMQLGLTWQKGTFKAQYGSKVFSQEYEYPRVFLSSNTPSGFFYYGYVVENSGFTSYILNNTVFARNTQSTPGANFTSYTDGYIGYVDTVGAAASEHMAATPQSMLSDTKVGEYSLDESNAWEDLFSQAKQAVEQNSTRLTRLFLHFAGDLTGFHLI